ncbi:MAG: phosphoribosylformylglycinamidine cyclo-ligase [Syntrophomonadaceae bacterium]|jgi:phosphoribosylformylglycinamidine cyclo-ligase|nr:phosphoribosylformylglycinamidine cyclo-ligase [Syntrophomonadaceae bacterium]MDH7497506.1 phosphoribosylformylglycinamidine cyclo-ligase [Syntrophomonadaceae bacterium]
MGEMSYRQAGVDIDAAERSVKLIAPWVRRTRRPEVLADIGAFGGFFALDTGRFEQPVLVAGADGVGTKLRIAHMTNIHDTVGIDLVAMCVNDVLVHGAEPLFFLDYLAVGRLDPAQVEALVKGVAEGCVRAGCALIGGETAEMPGFYQPGEYDMAGFAVGAVSRDRLIDGSAVRPGDVVIGLRSSGLHSNGYSLARKVLLEHAGYRLEQVVPSLGRTLAEELLEPTRIYVKPVLQLLEGVAVSAMAHITGGGLVENVARVLPPGCGVVIEQRLLPRVAVFELLRELGDIAPAEMVRTFNMGIGFVIMVRAEEADGVLRRLTALGEEALVIGQVCADASGVEIR